MQATLSLLFGCRAFCLLNELVSIMLAFFPGGFLTKVCQLLQKSWEFFFVPGLSQSDDQVIEGNLIIRVMSQGLPRFFDHKLILSCL